MRNSGRQAAGQNVILGIRTVDPDLVIAVLDTLALQST